MTTIILKRNTTAGTVPTANDLALGELAVNTADAKVFLKDNNDNIVEIGSGTGTGTGSGTGVAGDYATSVIADGATNYYRLADVAGGNAANDTIGTRNGSHSPEVAISVDSPITSDPNAKSTKASASQKGTTYVDNSDGALDLAPGDGSFTIEAWAKHDVNDGNFIAVASIWANVMDSSQMWYLLLNSDNRVRLILNGTNDADYQFYSNNSNIKDNNWHHIVATYSGNTTKEVKIYIDGALDSTGSMSVDIDQTSTRSFVIGGVSDNPTAIRSEYIAEPAYYPGTVLSLAQVQAHYAAATSGNYEATVVADSPLLYYRFNDTAVVGDDAIDTRDGVYVGSVAQSTLTPLANDTSAKSMYTTGDLEGSLRVDNSDAALSPNGNPFSLEFWVKHSPTVSDIYGVMTMWLNGIPGQLFFAGIGSSGRARFSVNGSNETDYNYEGTTIVNDNNWHHIVATYSGNGTGGRIARIFVDGQLEAENTVPIDITLTSTEALMIGGSSDGARPSPDFIAEPAYYNGVALTAAQVAQHYNNGLGIGTISTTVTDLGTIASGTQDLNASLAGGYKYVAAGNHSLTLSSWPIGEMRRVLVEITNGGSHTITWPAEVVWDGGVAPTLTAADVIELMTFDNGTTVRARRIWQAS